MPPRSAEWLEADGLGGFAMGTVDGVRTRRYHGLLIHATTPPTGRMALLNGFEAWVDLEGMRLAITSQRYTPDVIYPDGYTRVGSFTHDPWPRWRFDLGRGLTLEQELFVLHGVPLTALSWRLSSRADARLELRPLLSGRDAQALHRANPAFDFRPEIRGPLLAWRPYSGVPGVLSLANAEYRHAPEWYYDFLYEQERALGLGHLEDLASPGLLSWNLGSGEAVWIVAAETSTTRTLMEGVIPDDLHEQIEVAEGRRRTAFRTRLHRAADAYIVARRNGRTILAGYPWFADWGRDTFIALRGLCLAGDRLDDAREILVEWASTVSQGMLPNRFPERGEALEFNSVDASLWYVIAVHDWIEAMAEADRAIAPQDLAVVRGAALAILEGYTRGTRHGIRQDADGLLAAGEPGVQLTWMDAKIGDWVVTPRIGKPVEVEALWINALWIGGQFDSHWREACERSLRAFEKRFWNAERGGLYDVVDVSHVAGTADPSLRPNQIFAVGGLPLAVLENERARSIVDLVERELWTPLGLRSLAPGEPGYVPHYGGGVRERDGAYHQGTAWTWLVGPFVEAWCRVRGDTDQVRREARERFVRPLLDHLEEAGLGHVSEIADGDPPHVPKGCPFQAWSLGELMRLERRLTRAAGAQRHERAQVGAREEANG